MQQFVLLNFTVITPLATRRLNLSRILFQSTFSVCIFLNFRNAFNRTCVRACSAAYASVLVNQTLAVLDLAYAANGTNVFAGAARYAVFFVDSICHFHPSFENKCVAKIQQLIFILLQNFCQPFFS